MKAWKSRTDALGNLDQCDYEDDGPPIFTDVLVIDASDFPENSPEIGSKWLTNEIAEGIVTVATNPYFDMDALSYGWHVTVKDNEGSCWEHPIDNLKPIPTEATGEVVGTLTIDENGGQWQNVTDVGTYDIIRRPK